MSGIQVLVVSDSVLLCDGVRAVLSDCPELEVVAQTDMGHRAVEAARRLQPSILILVLSPAHREPLALLEQLRNQVPDTRVIAVGYPQDESTILHTLEMGIKGYLCNHEGAEELIDAVRAILAGDVFLCPDVSDILIKHYRRKAGVVERGDKA